MDKINAEDVVEYFEEFVRIYWDFRSDNGLINKKRDPFEICTSMADKLGRIARQVKHKERHDPKEDWPEGMTEAATGLIVYLLLLMEHYEVDTRKGMAKELNEAVKQHGKK